MGVFTCIPTLCCNPIFALSSKIMGVRSCHLRPSSFFLSPLNFRYYIFHFQSTLVVSSVHGIEEVETDGEEKPRFRWVEIGSSVSEEQKQAILQLATKMTKRSKALMRQLICFSAEKGSLSHLLATWVKSTKPRRADWLSVLKELNKLNHPLFFEVGELALLEESFEANVRDYTKLIHGYAKQNWTQDAENIVLAMKRKGFTFDQVILTALIHMYSKSGNLKLAKDAFEEMKLLGVRLDRRSYGSMIMAYIRAGMLNEGESLLHEMEAQEIYAGREIYKALLRTYSMIGNSEGAQRVFNAIQLAGITPDIKLCALLINAYVVAGQSQEACIAFENLRRAGLEPNDKCVALILTAFEKENKLSKALEFLIGLERDGTMLGKEASELLAGWFGRMGVVKEVELVLRNCCGGK